MSFTSEHVFAEEGVWPEQITDLKGIQGDTSDNIPGVKGVSSAVPPLLAEYGTVEAMYEAIHDAETDKKQLKELQDFLEGEAGDLQNSLQSADEDRGGRRTVRGSRGRAVEASGYH